MKAEPNPRNRMLLACKQTHTLRCCSPSFTNTHLVRAESVQVALRCQLGRQGLVCRPATLARSSSSSDDSTSSSSSKQLLAGALQTAPQQDWHVQQTSACAGCTAQTPGRATLPPPLRCTGWGALVSAHCCQWAPGSHHPADTGGGQCQLATGKSCSRAAAAGDTSHNRPRESETPTAPSCSTATHSDDALMHNQGRGHSRRQ
jgi:hypothetical protein